MPDWLFTPGSPAVGSRLVEIRVPVDGGEVWAEDRGTGPALVLIHPGWGDAGIWSSLLTVLGDRCRVIRYDDRGYGRSPTPDRPFTRLADLRSVEDMADGTVLHVPPAADELPTRVQRLCDFANGSTTDAVYVPPVIRAIIVHFMLAFDHPFLDGNGRTARVLFYWSMLHQDYWLAEFLPISRLLRQAPSKYARSFLYCEQDDGDLTYFLVYQLGIIQRAIADLQTYVERKVIETRRIQESLALLSSYPNYRQIALLGNAVKNPHARYTVQSHSRSHNVVTQTARTDLQGLENKGFLLRDTGKRGHEWTPAHDLPELLDPAQGAVERRRQRSRRKQRQSV